MIVFANPNKQNQKYKKEIFKSIGQVFDSNNYILGKEVINLENNFAKFNKVKYGVGVANGTDSIEIALRSLDIGKNDEVITVSHTAPATISAIFAVGSKPVLLDVEDTFYTLNPDLIERSITKKTKCVILVHLYGLVGNIEKIKKICKKKSIFLIEDASQAHGSFFKNKRIGSFGDIGCLSLYPTKNLGGIGDAGMMITKSKKLFNKMKLLRQYGWNKNKLVTMPGRNSRLDEIQAAIINIKLKYLDSDNSKRRKIADYYFKNIVNKKFIKPSIRKNTLPVFHLFVLQCEERNKFINYMKKNNILCGIHYEIPTHKHPGFKNSKIIGKLSVTNKICKKIVSIPIYPELSLRDVKYITGLINKFK